MKRLALLSLLLINCLGQSPHAPAIRSLNRLDRKDVIGKYTFFSGFDGGTLDLLSSGRFKSTYSDDVIVPGEETPVRRKGRWGLRNSLVQVTYDKPKGRPKQEAYIPVKWDDAWFLIRIDQKKYFMSFVKGLRDAARKEGDRGVYGSIDYLYKGVPRRALAGVLVPKSFLKEFEKLERKMMKGG